MSAKRTSSVLIGALFIGALSGCEVTRVDCDETPDADICQDDPEEDAGGDWEDADTPEEDASLDGGRNDGGRDAGSSDAGDARADGSTSDAATSDASQDAGSPNPLTIDEFCIEQLKTAVAWRDELEAACVSANSTERNSFLGSVFGYTDDAEDRCVTNLKGIVDAGNTTFDGTKAQACADKFRDGYDGPPSPFPTTGVDVAMYAASIGHGAPVFVQLPECRAAFRGKVARDKTCTDSLECMEGLRCMQAPGGTRTCQPALTIGTCTRTSECADGHICVGSDAGGGKTCVKSSELPSTGGNCTLSAECSEGLICNDTKKCGNPTAQVICKP